MLQTWLSFHINNYTVCSSGKGIKVPSNLASDVN